MNFKEKAFTFILKNITAATLRRSLLIKHLLIMKKTLLLVFIMATSLLGSLSTNAQKAKVIEGSWKNLNGVKSYKVEITYDDMLVGKKEKMTEKDYLQDRKEKRNAKLAESGDKWVESWNNDKAKKFPERFKLLLSSHIKKRGGKVDDNAKVRLVVKTKMIEPGYNVGVWRQNAYINVEYHFIDESGKTLLVLEMLSISGKTAFGTDFDTGVRIGESYALAGKILAGYLNKNALRGK